MFSRTNNFNVLDEDQFITMSFSLEADFEGVSGQVSQELWHSLDLNESILVHIEMSPGFLEFLSQKYSGRFWCMGVADLGSSILGSSLIEEEETSWLSGFIFHLNGVGCDERLHESVISFLSESSWDDSSVATLSFAVAVDWSEGIDATKLNSLVIGGGFTLGLTKLELGPVIVEEAGEGAVWVSVLWHSASDIWLWVLSVFDSSLELSPVIVEMAGEGAVWMSVLWHSSSDVGLWVFRVLHTGLDLSPVIVEMAGESAIGVGVLWHSSSNIWLWVLGVLNSCLKLGPVIVEEAREGGIWMSVLWHSTSDIWLRIFSVLDSGLELSPIIVEVTGEGAIGMSVLWHSSSDIWLRIFSVLDSSLKLCPVIVEVAGES
jgi:hypothetical protein